MSNLKLDLDSFKSSGVYTLEYDNTVQETIGAESFRLAVGFTEHGPFNRPVFLANQTDRKKIFGNINTKLEKRGSFFDRSLDIMLEYEPTIALNLMPVYDTDKVGMATFCLSVDDSSHIDTSISYKEFFDRSKFWIPSTDNLKYIAVRESLDNNSKGKYKENANRGPILSVVNLETQNATIFILKEDNLAGYNVTFKNWYEGMELPYKWINPNDYVSDYFVKVIAIKGDWSDASQLSKDMTWKNYFDEDGLKVSEVAKFINNDNVNLIGSWSGIILPNFFNKSGKLVSIDSVVNSYTVNTGIMLSINEDALESLVLDNGNQYIDENYDDVIDSSEGANVAPYRIDMVGHFVNSSTSNVKILSYNSVKAEDIISNIKCDNIEGNIFTIIPEDASDYVTYVKVGDLVEGENGLLTKIVKKIYNKEKQQYIFTCGDVVKNVISSTPATTDETLEEGEGDENATTDASNNTTNESSYSIIIHKTFNDVFTHANGTKLIGFKITNKHRPGFNDNGEYNVEEGVEKIYKLLTDEEEGIYRGLKNKDMVSFRYIVDTLDGGIDSEMGGKRHLAKLAKAVGQCTALINFPSISLLKTSTDPIFCDNKQSINISKQFNTKYIPTGGNTESASSKNLTIFTKDGGSDYSAMFSPFLRYNSGGRSVLIPPAAHVANAFMVKYKGGNPYATIANTNGYLNDNKIIDLEYIYDDTDRDNLEPFGVNPIIMQNAKPTIYGNRTCYQEVISDLNYLHVRELLNKLELESRAVLKPFTFRTNNAVTRAECVRSLNPIYEAALLSGALYSYNIIMDETNNTSEVISRAFGIVDIEVQVNKNMEKIVQRITLEKIEY